MPVVTITVSVSAVPKADFFVEVFRSDGNIVTSGVTNSSGVFAPTLPSGDYTVRCTQPKYTVSSWTGTVSTLPVSVSLTPTLLIAGDTSFAPSVTLWELVSGLDDTLVSVESFSAGSFALWLRQKNNAVTTTNPVNQSISINRNALIRNGFWSVPVYADSFVRITINSVSRVIFVPANVSSISVADCRVVK